MRDDGCVDRIKLRRLSLYDKKSEKSGERLRQNEPNDVWRHQILFNTRYQESCDDRNFRKKNLRNPREQIFDEFHQEPLASQEKALPLLVEEGDFHR